MQTRDENKLTMYIIIRDFLLMPLSAAITVKWSKFAALFTRFTGLIDSIQITAGKQDEDNTGITLSKNAIRRLLEASMEDISAKGQAYAAGEGDLELLNKIKFMKGELGKMSDEALVKKAKSLQANIAPHVTGIKEYDLEDAEVDELETLTQQFGDMYSKPQASTKETDVETDSLPPLFREADGVLAVVDKMVKSAKKKSPGFVAEYFAKRKIDNQGRRMRSMYLQVKDALTGEALGQAKVTLTILGTELTKSVKRTGTMGGLYYNNLGDGEYRCEIIKTGYVTQTVTCYVNSGEMTRVVVMMVRK